MSNANINVRTDAVLKAQAQQIFESIGLDLSTAVNLFLKQTVRVQNLPFVVGTVYINPGEPQSPLLSTENNDKTSDEPNYALRLGFAKGAEIPDSFFEPLPEEELQLWGL